MDNLSDSGGRVTRSLRKRLTSIDVDISNRPITPISSTLTSISEMSSPSRVVRATRRNSTSAVATPVKTPSKTSSSISAIAEDLEIFTPTKRWSRRHRISINEKEESSQNITKAFLSDEEIVESDTKSTIVTRSQSKSPQASRSLNNFSIKKTRSAIESRSEENENEFINTENVKKRKPGPRSKTRIEDQIIEEISDGEISAFGNEVENVKNNSLKNVYNDKWSHMAIEEKAENQPDSKKCDLNDFGEEETSHINTLQIERDEPFKCSESINSLNVVDLNCIKSPIEVKENENDCIITEDEGKRKSGRKNNTQVQHTQIDENISVDETSNFGNEVEDFKNKSLKNVDIDESCKSTENSLHIIKDDLELLNKSNIGEKKKLNINELEKDELKNATIANICCIEDSIDKKINEKKSSEQESLHYYGSTIDSKRINNVQDDLKLENALECDQSILQSDEVGLSKSELQDDIYLKFSPEAEEKLKTPEIGVSSIKTSPVIDYKEELKKVNFNSTLPNDMTPKSSYPKTPVSIKLIKNLQHSRSQSSFQCTGDLQAISSNKSGNDISTTNNDSDTEPHQVYTIKCLNEDLLTMEEINTTKDQAELHHEESKEGEKIEISTNKILNDDNENELRWVNPSARGKSSDGSKIDVFITKYNSNNDFKQKDQEKMNSFLSDEDKYVNKQKDQEEVNSLLSDEDKNVDENYSEEDESSMLKHVFYDDEAMQVDNYNSGDSMTSEERREIGENEIPCNAESIGSQTTGDESIEESEDNDDFIVSDNAELDLYESDDEDGGIDENTNEHYDKHNKLKYKRIIRIEDSSSSSEEVEKGAYSRKHRSENEPENFGEKLAISINQPLSSSENNIVLDANKQVDLLMLRDSANKSESEEESNEVEKRSSEEIQNQSDSLKKLNHLDSEIYGSPIKCAKNSEMNESTNNNEKAFNEERTISTIQGESDHLSYNTEMKRTVKEMEHTPLSLQCDRQSALNTISNQNNITEMPVLYEHSFAKDLKSEQPETVLKKLNKTMLNSSSLIDHEEPSVAIEHTKYLEDCRHQLESLGNPLVHTRHQSLAIQVNLDVEMTNVNNTDQQIDRKSLGVLSSIDYNTSEVHKIERNQIAAKRKRLSKSFSGVSEALNNNNIELSSSQVDKTSISIDGSGIEDCENSTQNINYRNIFTKNKPNPNNKPNKNYFHNSQHILKRCDEILEAANLAKLEVKIRNRKRKNKIPKKKSVSSSSAEVRPDDKIRKISKDVRCKDKNEISLSNAVNSEDDIVNNKRKITCHNENEDMTEPIERSVPTKKKKKKEIVQHSEEMKDLHIASSSAGNFVEMPQPSEKKIKKCKYIQLASGKVIVEPVTPKKRLVKTYDGMEFRESPIFQHAVGFKVSKISSSENILRLGTAGIQKRKRCKKPVKDYIKPTVQWTKSGIFTEEISKRGRNRREQNVEESNVNHNFKEKSIMRANIKRSNKREILLLKQRRQMH